MTPGPIRDLLTGGKLLGTLHVIYSGARDFVSRFLRSLGCFDAGMRLVHEWRREILGSIEGIPVGMEKMKGYD
jgi:hypothetical protein